MKNIKYYIGQGLMLLALTVGSVGVTSCSDYFDVESTHNIDANKNHLKTATDTIYSVIGILKKVQAIGDRTVLLGEMRGDLTTVTDATSSDLRDVARFSIGEDNMYNDPRDYYAIINNCNYFIANVDTAMRNNRNEQIFLREYAAVKAIRAWTYLQLVLNYGKVPFVTEPIMTEADANRDYPLYGIQEICNYFTTQDNLKALADKGFPQYGDIRKTNINLYFFPINVVLGDMNLWAGNYWEAAKCYHEYIITRNGYTYGASNGSVLGKSAYPTTQSAVLWASDDFTVNNTNISGGWADEFMSESYSSLSELITLIPGDSLPSDGNYSQLRNIFNSTGINSFQFSATPSQALLDLSAAQKSFYFDRSAMNFVMAPKGLPDNADGDLRLWSSYRSSDQWANRYTGERVTNQQIAKHQTRNVHIYRRTQIYLRLAEALNRAGYPKFAFKILSTGVDNKVIEEQICTEYPADSAKLIDDISFPTGQYGVYDPVNYDSNGKNNMIGIHMRGCGFVMGDTTYILPVDSTITDPQQHLQWQIEQVEDLIMDECALECAFEGTRYYDLMRVAMHRNDPAYLANKIARRNGEGKPAGVDADLMDMKNWFMHWQEVGY